MLTSFHVKVVTQFLSECMCEYVLVFFKHLINLYIFYTFISLLTASLVEKTINSI